MGVKIFYYFREHLLNQKNHLELESTIIIYLNAKIDF